MRYELYINGEKVDMVQESITLTMKSNLLGEFGKIVAGSSQTVKLPITSKNRRILGLPEIGTLDGGSVRRRLKATLLSNGIGIINDGIAVILKATEDSYEIGITYGVISFLQQVKDAGKLNEMNVNTEYSLLWNSTSLQDHPISNFIQQYGWGEYDNGVNDANIINVHPVVSCSFVWTLLKTYTFNFDVKFSDGQDVGGIWYSPLEYSFDKYLLLLVTKNGSNKANSGGQAELDMSYQYGFRYVYGDNSYSTPLGTMKSNTTSYLSYEDITPHNGGTARIFKIIFTKAVDSYRLTYSVRLYNRNATAYTLYIMKNYKEPTLFSQDAVLHQVPLGDGSSYYTGGIDLGSMAKDDYLTFKIGANNDGDTATQQMSITIKNAVLTNVGEVPDVQYGDYYPIVPNLPDMKITEYIQFIGYLTGTFPMVKPQDPNTLWMVRIEDFDKSNAYDWSDKWDGTPEEMTYTYLEAQKNKIVYEKDDDVSGYPTEGEIRVNDDTLNNEAELIEIPLSASNGGSIHHYSYVDGQLQENSISPRLLYNYTGNYVGYVTECYPQHIIDKRWAKYKELVKSPVKIRGTFRLSEIDIKELDYMKPVYLQQTGRYYGIIQVQWKGDESVVELLQLPR